MFTILQNDHTQFPWVGIELKVFLQISFIIHIQSFCCKLSCLFLRISVITKDFFSPFLLFPEVLQFKTLSRGSSQNIRLYKYLKFPFKIQFNFSLSKLNNMKWIENRLDAIYYIHCSNEAKEEKKTSWNGWNGGQWTKPADEDARASNKYAERHRRCQ